MAGAYYDKGPLLARLMMRYRPYICPFHTLIQHIPQDATVMDVGCGGGLLLNLLAGADRIQRGLGFDYSPDMIRVASKAAQKHNTDIHFCTVNANDGWPRSTANTITAIDLLHHISPKDQDDVINKLIDTVPPGGRLVYKDMAAKPHWRASINRLHDLVLARQWIHYHPIAQVEQTATQKGLRLIASQDINQWWYRHELRVFERPAG